MKQSDIKHLVKESLREAFYQKKVINESMSLYIKGANYDRLEDMHEIGWKVAGPIWQFLEKLPKDQLDYFMKNRTAELLTPDGDDYFKPTGILNLYTAGLTRQALIGTMKIIFDGLKKLRVTYGKVKTEQSGTWKSGVIRIPILSNPHHGTYKGPPDLQMAQNNAYNIFHNVLQYEGTHDFHFKAREVIERIESLAHDQGWVDKNIIKPSDSDWPEAERDTEVEPDEENPHDDVIKQVGAGLGGARMIGGGQSADTIRYRLREVWVVAKWAIDHGFEDLYVA